jgi:hypothetical protein
MPSPAISHEGLMLPSKMKWGWMVPRERTVGDRRGTGAQESLGQNLIAEGTENNEPLFKSPPPLTGPGKGRPRGKSSSPTQAAHRYR